MGCLESACYAYHSGVLQHCSQDAVKPETNQCTISGVLIFDCNRAQPNTCKGYDYE